jgi:flagellin
MLSAQNIFSALDGIYASMAGRISNLPSTILLANPDRYTGTSITKDFLRLSIAENAANAGSVNEGISLVQAMDDVRGTIREKVYEMKELAENVVNGNFNKKEREALQEQFDVLADEITVIASQFNLGGGGVLAKDDDIVKISIGNGLSIDIDTKALTITGLSIIDNVDIVNDAQAAMAGLENALVEIDDYGDHLESKAGDLESAVAVLDAQRQSLLAVRSAVESADAAMIVVSILNDSAIAGADLLLVAQANANLMSDTVLHLIAA